MFPQHSTHLAIRLFYFIFYDTRSTLTSIQCAVEKGVPLCFLDQPLRHNSRLVRVTLSTCGCLRILCGCEVKHKTHRLEIAVHTATGFVDHISKNCAQGDMHLDFSSTFCCTSGNATNESQDIRDSTYCLSHQVFMNDAPLHGLRERSHCSCAELIFCASLNSFFALHPCSRVCSRHEYGGVYKTSRCLLQLSQ